MVKEDLVISTPDANTIGAASAGIGSIDIDKKKDTLLNDTILRAFEELKNELGAAALERSNGAVKVSASDEQSKRVLSHIEQIETQLRSSQVSAPEQPKTGLPETALDFADQPKEEAHDSKSKRKRLMSPRHGISDRNGNSYSNKLQRNGMDPPAKISQKCIDSFNELRMKKGKKPLDTPFNIKKVLIHYQLRSYQNGEEIDSLKIQNDLGSLFSRSYTAVTTVAHSTTDVTAKEFINNIMEAEFDLASVEDVDTLALSSMKLPDNQIELILLLCKGDDLSCADNDLTEDIIKARKDKGLSIPKINYDIIQFAQQGVEYMAKASKLLPFNGSQRKVLLSIPGSNSANGVAIRCKDAVDAVLQMKLSEIIFGDFDSFGAAIRYSPSENCYYAAAYFVRMA